MIALCSLLILATTGTDAYSDPIWSTKLDDDLRFYQTTEMGVLIAGTEKSLYAVDSETGDVLWRRRNMRVDQTDLAPLSALTCSSSVMKNQGDAHGGNRHNDRQSPLAKR